jgi:hypothetical protein
MEIVRKARLTKEEFFVDYLSANRPVIVTDAMDNWRALAKWTPEFFLSEFGKFDVQVYDDLFDLLDITSLERYLKRNFWQPAKANASEYIRWYSKLKDIDFFWSDVAFDRLRCDWETPYFLPMSSFVVPYCEPPNRADVTTQAFPYKGLFLSGRGARTRLHRDPFGTQAVLCQFYGRKHIRFYPPSDDIYLRRGGEFVDPAAPDLDRFPEFGRAKHMFDDILVPGDVLFIPDGWLHDVTSISDSVSVTWNFVHRTRLKPFLRALSDDPLGGEIDVVRYFLSAQTGQVPSVGDILAFFG